MPTNIFGLLHVPRSFSLQESLDFYSMPEPMSGCFLWLGALRDYRYAALHWKGAQRQASQLAWEVRHGPVPDGLMICHHCDNSICVNADHLFLGTAQDNNDDMIRKGRARYPRGTDHYACRLSDDDVRAIRISIEDRQILADRYSIHPDTVYGIRAGHKRGDVHG